MKLLDRILQRWRIRQAATHLGPATRLIDIGAFHGELFEHLGSRLTEGFGIEPLRQSTLTRDRYTITPGFFPSTRPPNSGWDAITMMAVLEHIPIAQQADLVQGCFDCLREGGRVIITIPTPCVDRILAMLHWAHAIDGMSLEEHYGFDPTQTEKLFAPPYFRLVKKTRFQLGLNNLFVFERLPSPLNQS